MTNKWKPIADAPRDETHVLGCRFAGSVIDWAHECWWPAIPHGTMWKYRSGYCAPTHWIDCPEKDENHAV